MDSSIRMTFLCSAFSVICVFAPFFVDLFFFPRIGMYAASRDRRLEQLLAGEVLRGLLGHRPAGSPAAAALVLRDVDELALTAERARDDLELADLAERAGPGSGRVLLARGRRRRHAADRHERTRDDDGLGRRRAQRAGSDGGFPG